MNTTTIDLAIAEAKRFIERAESLKTASKPVKGKDFHGQPYDYIPNVPRESGAVRRSSLDPTRALADLRRP